MSISHQYFVFDGRTYKPDNISFGDAETEDVIINGLSTGTVNTVQLTKRQATLSAEGLTGDILQELEVTRAQNIKDLLRNQPSARDLNFGGYLIEQALLKKYTPSAPQTIDGITIFKKVDIVYDSLVFT